MMNVREYFEAYQKENNLTYDEMINFEDEMYDLYKNNFDAFKAYMAKHNVDLRAWDLDINESVLTLWVWDMCDE